MASRRDYTGGQAISTVYFGGGTPSLLPDGEVFSILDALNKLYTLSPAAEITLEANPDDVSSERLDEWRSAGINRLSLGVQSFFDEDLLYLGRVHNGIQAERSVLLSLDKGFTSLSVDFIYGMPVLSDDHLERNLTRAVDLGIPHISAYALTVEPKTALDSLIRKNKTQGPDDEKAASQFMMVMNLLGSFDYEHYEISNFCLPGKYSRHNSAYWNGEHYLGLGPSAHSYNGISRRWNISSITQYSSLVSADQPFSETEVLTPAQKHNEYIMTSLRTKWGTSPGRIRDEFGEENAARFRALAKIHIDSGDLTESDGNYILTSRGKLFADAISAGLFLDNES
jgi:oxygen-independent coproporphyrinogen III oxidase